MTRPPLSTMARRVARRAARRVVEPFAAWLLPPHASPVFVTGNQKSGTTVVAALLAARAGRCAALDLRREIRRPTYPLVRCGAWTFEHLRRRNAIDFARPIIKEANLLTIHGPWRAMYPKAPVIFVIRDPRDNTRSILDRLDLPGTIDRWPADAPGPGWALYREPSWLGLPARHPIDVLAARWCLAADLCRAEGDRVFRCRYEDFLADRVATIDRLATAVGLPPRRPIEHLLRRPFQRPGRRDRDWVEFFGTANLARLEASCAELAAHHGYPRHATRPVEVPAP